MVSLQWQIRLSHELIKWQVGVIVIHIFISGQYNIIQPANHNLQQPDTSMQKKVVVSAAQRLAQLKTIPFQKLPSTLKKQIKLPNIQEVRLSYRPMCKNVGPSLKFVRQYGPALKFHNPGLAVVKKQQQNGPLAMTMQIFRKGASQPQVIIPNQMKTTQQLLGRIRQIDNK